MPSWIKGKDNEEKWEKAKEIVKKQYSLTEDDGEDFWKLVVGVYKRMGGEIKKADEMGVIEHMSIKRTGIRNIENNALKTGDKAADIIESLVLSRKEVSIIEEYINEGIDNIWVKAIVIDIDKLGNGFKKGDEVYVRKYNGKWVVYKDEKLIKMLTDAEAKKSLKSVKIKNKVLALKDDNPIVKDLEENLKKWIKQQENNKIEGMRKGDRIKFIKRVDNKMFLGAVYQCVMEPNDKANGVYIRLGAKGNPLTWNESNLIGLSIKQFKRLLKDGYIRILDPNEPVDAGKLSIKEVRAELKQMQYDKRTGFKMTEGVRSSGSYIMIKLYKKNGDDLEEYVKKWILKYFDKKGYKYKIDSRTLFVYNVK